MAATSLGQCCKSKDLVHDTLPKKTANLRQASDVTLVTLLL